MRSKMAIWVSAGLALLATVLMFVYMSGREAELLQLGAMKDVVVASQDILANTVIDESMLQRIQIPAKYMQPQAISEPRDLRGRVAVVPVPKGGQILNTFLEDEGRQALAYEVPVGRRAVSIGVTAVSGVGGLVRPGNFVDIMGTFELGRPVGYEGGRMKYADERTETQVLMQNVQIVAIGREHRRERQAQQAAAGAPMGIGAEVAAQSQAQNQQPFDNVTVIVSARDAQALVLAQEVGTLTLALRSNLDTGQIQDLGPLDPLSLLKVPIPVKPRSSSGPFFREMRGAPGGAGF